MLSNNIRNNINMASLNSQKSNSEHELVKGITSEATAYVLKLIPALKSISTDLRAGNIGPANTSLSEAIEGLDWMAQLISILKERYGEKFGNLTCNSIKASDMETDLLNILTEIMTTQVNRNWNLMADLLELELTHNLNLWATLFPTVAELE